MSKDLIKKPEKKAWPGHRCPYLGLAHDPDTVISKPSQWNLCFHVKRAAPVALEHQSSYCLSPGYRECEVFKKNLTASLPNGIRGNQFGDTKRKLLLISIGLIQSVLVLVGVRVWLGSLHGLLGFFRDGLSTRTPTLEFTIKTTLTSTITIYPTHVNATLASTISSLTSSPSFIPPTLTPTASYTSVPPTLTPSATFTSTRYFLIPTYTPVPTSPPSPPKHTPVPPTSVPPTSVPPTSVPPTSVPPTSPPTSGPPTSAPTPPD